MFAVELDIFSGRPNPRWNLSSTEQRELLDRVLSGAVPIAPLATTDGVLGYRGFIIRANGAEAQALAARGIASSFRVRDGLGQSIDFSAESWLLYTGEPIEIPEGVRGVVRSSLSTPADAADDGIDACKGHFTSSTNFDKWNGSRMGSNNCYNFASNNQTDTFAQPGRGTGEMYHAITAPEIEAAAIRDGYEKECSGTNLLVGFAIWPGADYHWWRRTKPMDGEQRWCHKPGGTAARNRDSSGEYITDPSTCNRGPYTVWGNFLNGPGKKRKTIR